MNSINNSNSYSSNNKNFLKNKNKYCKIKKFSNKKLMN